MRLAGFLATLAITGTTTVAGGRRAAGVDVIYLPVGFNPEGIAKGRGDTFYTGSLTGKSCLSFTHSVFDLGVQHAGECTDGYSAQLICVLTN